MRKLWLEIGLVLIFLCIAFLEARFLPSSLLLGARPIQFFVGILVGSALPFYLGRIALRSTPIVFFLCLIAVIVAIFLTSMLEAPMFWLRTDLTPLFTKLLWSELFAAALFFLGRAFQQHTSPRFP